MARAKKPKLPKQFILRPWLISSLRRGFRRYPPYYETLNEGREVFYIESKHGKPLKRVVYPCPKCGNKYKQSEVVVDHIIPIVPETGFPRNADGTDDWTTYVNRMYCPKSNLQRLCRGCHQEKSNVENKERRTNRAKKLD